MDIRLTMIENLNELLLLTVQSVCNQLGVKIPWANVAETMGNNVTEGAIVQHLAKLRTRRIAANKEVPPPLRRGGSGTMAIVKAKSEQKTGIGPSNAKGSGKNKGKDRESLSDEDEVAGLPETWEESSDEEYGKRRRSKTNKCGQRKKAKAKSAGTVIKIEDTEADTDMDDLSDGVVGVGAQFLNFSNNRELPSSPVGDSQDAKPNNSKVVVFSFNERRSGFKRLIELVEGGNDSGAQQSQALVLGNPYVQDHYQESDAGANGLQDDGMLGFQTLSDPIQSGLPDESMFSTLFNENNYHHSRHTASFSSGHHDYQNNCSIGGSVPSQQDQGTFLPYPNSLISQYSDMQDGPAHPRMLPESVSANLDPWLGTGLSLNNNSGLGLVHRSSSASDSGDNANSAGSGALESVPKEYESFDDEGYGDVHSMHAQLLNQFIGYPLIGSPDASH